MTQQTDLVSPRDFETFYRDERDRLVRALSLTLRNDEVGGDAADEAMARAYQRWDSVGGYANPAGWVYRVGLNWALSRRRKTSREVVAEVVERRVTDPGFHPDIERELARLPLDQRAVLVLRFYLDWDIEGVAAALGVPKGTVKSRQSRGLAAIARRLEVRP